MRAQRFRAKPTTDQRGFVPSVSSPDASRRVAVLFDTPQRIAASRTVRPFGASWKVAPLEGDRGAAPAPSLAPDPLAPGPGGVIYAITPEGDLLWYRHDGRADGSVRWAANTGMKIGAGWTFEHVFPGDAGVIYAVTDGYADGNATWAAGGEEGRQRLYLRRRLCAVKTVVHVGPRRRDADARGPGTRAAGG